MRFTLDRLSMIEPAQWLAASHCDERPHFACLDIVWRRSISSIFELARTVQLMSAVLVVGFAAAGAAITIAIATFADIEGAMDRGETLAYGIGGVLFGGLMGGLLSWAISGRRK